MPLTQDQISLLEANAVAADAHLEQIAEQFYRTLFERHPAVRPLFAGTDTQVQKTKLAGAIRLVVRSLRQPEQLARALGDMGRRHEGYGAVEAHYGAVADVLVDTLARANGTRWNPQLEGAWRTALNDIAAAMLGGYTRKL